MTASPQIGAEMNQASKNKDSVGFIQGLIYNAIDSNEKLENDENSRKLKIENYGNVRI